MLALLVGLNAFVLDRETGKAHLTVPGAELVETTSGPLQVLDSGLPGSGDDGLPLVLIHGTGGAIDWWDDLIPGLSDDRRVIVVDLLGYGGSAKPESGYSIESQAGLLAQVLHRLEIDRAVVVGHSLGGSVATAMGKESPDLVAGVVLIDSSPDRDTGGLDLTARAALAPVIGPLLWRLAPDALLRRGLSQAFAPGFDVPDRFVDDLKAMTYPAWRESARAGERFAKESSLPDRLQATGLPLLVIFGEEDRIYPAREALSAYAGVPGVKTVLIPGSGHSPQVEDPKRTADEILGFTAGIERADRAREKAAERREARRAEAARRARAKAKQKAERKKRKKAGRKSSKAGRGGKKANSR